MGLFKFVKNAGANLFKKKKTEVETVEEVKKANAFELVTFISGLGLEIENLEIQVNGDKVIVGGVTPDMATREKVILAVGNVEGVAEVEDKILIKPAEVEAKFHTVVSGDTLGKIAKEFYGDAMKYPVIFEANKPMLSHPDKIYSGQVLRIPAL
ncbi:MAG: peptidoglycan-binding protein LysM [Bacteroidetes bacterium]|nr:peptidoglycan-binding protein LysM [Bacteroidota bacterium]